MARHTPYTREEAAELGRKGGYKSAEIRRRNRSFREALSLMLACKLPKESPYYSEAKKLFEDLGIVGEPTVRDLVNLGILQKAASGDVPAATFVRDSVGEKPTDVVENREPKPPVVLGVIPLAATPKLEAGEVIECQAQ